MVKWKLLRRTSVLGLLQEPTWIRNFSYVKRAKSPLMGDKSRPMRSHWTLKVVYMPMVGHFLGTPPNGCLRRRNACCMLSSGSLLPCGLAISSKTSPRFIAPCQFLWRKLSNITGSQAFINVCAGILGLKAQLRIESKFCYGPRVSKRIVQVFSGLGLKLIECREAVQSLLTDFRQLDPFF